MNYIELINNFWLIDEQKGFNGHETRLYFFLLCLGNRLFWKMEWLEYGDDKMQAYIGISAATLRTSRNKLKAASLIDFVVGGQEYRTKTRYKILTPNPTPCPDPIHYNKTNTKTNNLKTAKNERYSKREFVASGSDFD
ncbi:hypothetical protein FACS189411_07360 [Bacteroidia bacterium]|nr:hypothetical protein FACS189411_07360 [Bacteroidia bacterium]